MGVKGLYTLIKKHTTPSVARVSDFAGQWVAIDTSIVEYGIIQVIYKYLSSLQRMRGSFVVNLKDDQGNRSA